MKNKSLLPKSKKSAQIARDGHKLDLRHWNFVCGGVIALFMSAVAFAQTPPQTLPEAPYGSGAYGVGAYGVGVLNPDTEPPSIPQDLVATEVTSSEVTLQWSAATDNIGVTGYEIFRDTVFLTTITELSFIDSGLTQNTSYTYVIRAKDAAGNSSSDSAPVTVTTQAGVPSCELLYPSGSTPQEGYGASWNLFSVAQELFLNATCLDTFLNITAGGDVGVLYTYKNGYRWNGSSWQPFAYTGANPIGDWFRNSVAQATVPKNVGTTYFVSYICQYIDNTWKCGCSDATCAEAKWQFQAVR